MTGDHDCSISRGSEICLGGLDHPLDVSTGRVVDEWIDAGPIRIAGMKNIRFRDGDGYIAVRMRATVIFEGKRGAIEGQSLLRRENFGRNRRQRRRREVEIPVLDPLGDQEMLTGVLIGQNAYPFRLQPLSAVRVIEMPVGVDQMSDRIAAEAVRCLQDSRAGCGESAIDEHLAVATGQDSDIAAGAVEETD